ncbi:hypothetical protein V1511DRAFT_504017 [Dipodascopsis uninucleata]
MLLWTLYSMFIVLGWFESNISASSSSIFTKFDEVSSPKSSFTLVESRLCVICIAPSRIIICKSLSKVSLASMIAISTRSKEVLNFAIAVCRPLAGVPATAGYTRLFGCCFKCRIRFADATRTSLNEDLIFSFTTILLAFILSIFADKPVLS